MRKGELAILLLFIGALALALAVWSWRHTPRARGTVYEDHLPEYHGPKHHVMPPW